MSARFFGSAVILVFAIFSLSACSDDNDTATPQPTHGTIIVDPQPDSIVPTWSLDGPDGYQHSGDEGETLEELKPGDYSLAWGTYLNWATPEPNPQVVSLEAGVTETIQGTYVPPPLGPFPSSPDVLMANFMTIYETRNFYGYLKIMHPDFLTILQDETIQEFPDVGETLDVNEELLIHQRMFSGDPVTDPNGDLVPGVANISFSRFIQLDAWAISPPTDIIPNAEWAPYDVDFLFDRGQQYSTLKVEGRIKFYVTSRDSMHQGSLRQYYQMIGQVDLTQGSKATEQAPWGSVKALYR